MPINIHKARKSGEENEEIAWLYDEEWELRAQIHALEEWLQAHTSLGVAAFSRLE